LRVVFNTNQLKLFFETDLSNLKGKQPFPIQVLKQYQLKIKILTEIRNLKELHPFRSLNFERLKGDRKHEYSIRLNKKYRLIFKEAETAIEIVIIEISKHYE
jgi:toxin HigB-1